MRYFKTVHDGYILAIGTGGLNGIDITEQEYMQIKNAIHSMPDAQDGYIYRLTESLEWENVKCEEIVDAE